MSLKALEQTKILLYMVSPNVYPGPDFPKGFDPNQLASSLVEYAAKNPGKVNCLATFTLAGEQLYSLVTAISYKYQGGKGWSLVSNRDNLGEVEVKFVDPHQGEKADMALTDVSYMVIAEVPAELDNTELTREQVIEYFTPTLDFLWSLL